MTVVGIALIAVGLAILVGGRRLLWGNAGERRRSRTGQDTRVIPTAAGKAGSRRSGMSLRRGGKGPTAPVNESADSEPETEVVVPRPPARRSRRRAASVSVGSAASFPRTDDDARPEPYGLASIGLADDDDDDDDVEDLERTVVSPTNRLAARTADGPVGRSAAEGEPADEDRPGITSPDTASVDDEPAVPDAAVPDAAHHDAAHHDAADHEPAESDAADRDAADRHLADHDVADDDTADGHADRDVADRSRRIGSRADVESAEQDMVDGDLSDADGADGRPAGSEPVEAEDDDSDDRPAGPSADESESESGHGFGQVHARPSYPASSHASSFADTPAARSHRHADHPYADRVHHADRVDGWVRPDYRQPSADLPVGGEYWTPVDGHSYGDRPDDHGPYDHRPNDRAYGNRAYADRAYGGRAYEDRAYGDRANGGYGRPAGGSDARSPDEPTWPYRPTFDPEAYAPGPPARPSSASQWPPAQRDDRYDTASTVSPSAYPMDGPVWARPSASDPSVLEPAWAGRLGVEVDGADLVQQAASRENTAREGEGQDAGAGAPDEPDPDRDGRHLPRRSRSAAARRNVTRAEPASEPAYRGRVNHPRLETRRRLTAPADLGSGSSDPTEMLPPVPVIEGYGTDGGRGEGARGRDADSSPRPRPRPRPRSQQGEDRQPNRSTVYVSRHAAEPN